MHGLTLLTACPFGNSIPVLLYLEKYVQSSSPPPPPSPVEPPSHVVSLWAARCLGLILLRWGPGCLPLERPGGFFHTQCGGAPEPPVSPGFQGCRELSEQTAGVNSTSPQRAAASTDRHQIAKANGAGAAARATRNPRAGGWVTHADRRRGQPPPGDRALVTGSGTAGKCSANASTVGLPNAPRRDPGASVLGLLP